MKKVLSVALAVLMICAISIPAFAVVENSLTDKGANTGDAMVKVDTGTMAGGTFEVRYPAETHISWNTKNTDIQYTSTTHLEAGKQLSVKVTKHKDYEQMKYLDYTLDYTLGGDTDVTVDTVTTTQTNTLNIGITEENWKTAPVAGYEAHLTFTVAVVDA